MNLLEKIRDKSAVVGVIGLGYVGLPLVLEFARQGFRVVGFDVDDAKVDDLMAARSYIKHIEAERIAKLLDQRFEATTDFQRLRETDAILICVPTPLTPTMDPDMTYVVGTAETIAESIRPEQLVVLESTTYPGTTVEVIEPILERSGLGANKDFFTAYSPEREDPGNRDFTTSGIPKVIGADHDYARDCATALYGHIVVETVGVSSTRAAEATKILENIYRSVNIALVNELKMLFDRMDIDIWEVIDAASTKPFGFQAFYPGPGLGGHCIPIDPFYLSWKAREFGVRTRFIELAGEVNTQMPDYVISRVADALNTRGLPIRNSRIMVLGLAYKKNVDDQRESPSIALIELLREKGAQVYYNDPHIPVMRPMRKYPEPEMESTPLKPEVLESMDAVLVSTDHDDYDYDFIARHARLIIDTRNGTRHVADPELRAKIVKA